MQDWFSHPPASNKPRDKVTAPPPSQIPGLTTQEPLSDDLRRRKHAMNDFGSKYIRLAKQGGRKNLLKFYEKNWSENEKVNYPRVDWFDHHQMSQQEEKEILSRSAWKPPDYMTSHQHENVMPAVGGDDVTNDDLAWARREGRRNCSKFQTRNAPFHTNDFQEENISSKKETKTEKKAVNDEEVTKFGKLLSGGYGEDWINKRDQVRMKQLEKLHNRLNNNNNSSLAPQAGGGGMSEYQQNISGRHHHIGGGRLKPLPHQSKSHDMTGHNWKLSRFDKIKPKVETRS